MVVIPTVGTICDKIHPTTIVPWAFVSQCIMIYLFNFIKDPNSLYSYSVITLLVVATIFEQLSCDSIFNKNLPQETRGMFNGLYSICNCIFIFIYTIGSGIAIDTYNTTKAPFFILGGLNILFVLLFVY